jgi:hypothetical protein
MLYILCQSLILVHPSRTSDTHATLLHSVPASYHVTPSLSSYYTDPPISYSCIYSYPSSVREYHLLSICLRITLGSSILDRLWALSSTQNHRFIQPRNPPNVISHGERPSTVHYLPHPTFKTLYAHYFHLRCTRHIIPRSPHQLFTCTRRCTRRCLHIPLPNKRPRPPSPANHQALCLSHH